MKPVLNRDMQTLNYDIIIGFKLSYGVPLFILVTTNELSNNSGNVLMINEF